jgi:hypothetical protein
MNGGLATHSPDGLATDRLRVSVPQNRGGMDYEE